MCQSCGNFDRWNWGTGVCGCGCSRKKGDKGEPGIQGKAGTYPANVFSAAPLMTSAQILAYANPSRGLVAYCTTTGGGLTANTFVGYTTTWKTFTLS